MSRPKNDSEAVEYARQVCDYTKDASFVNTCKVYKIVLDDPDMPKTVIAEMGKNDRYFLLVVILDRHDAYHPWLYERCREVEASPDGHIDLWAREHYKSTIGTFAGSIQEIAKDPEITIGIFSHTKGISRSFVGQIKRECENNPRLHDLYPEVFWENPKKESGAWSLDTGLLFKRKSNPKEMTVEGWGLVDGQPTALSVDTPTLTVNGWKPHGELCIGDYVFDETGNPVEVIFNTGPMHGQKCYNIEFKDTAIVAAADHLWPVDSVVCPRDPKTNRQTRDNQYLLRSFVRTEDLPISRGKNKSKRKFLPRTPAINLPKTLLPLDPYVLGIWLGDGSTNQEMVTTSDMDVVAEIEAAGFPCEVKQDRDTYKMYRPHGLWSALKQVGVAGNKHIPDNYLLSCAGDRLSLLQGLMDSDGHCATNGWGQSVFTNTNKNLVDGVHFLAASLGLHPTKIRRYTRNDPNHNDVYLVGFLGIKSDRPFRLKRKLKRCRNKRKNGHRYVHRLREVRSVPVNCIQVRSATGLYLAGRSLVVTHNSKHFKLMIYDDVVTEDSTTDVMLPRTTKMFQLSRSLSSKPEDKDCNFDGLADDERRMWIIGTRYHFSDTYDYILRNGIATPRLYPATDTGTPDGNPVFFSKKDWETKKRENDDYNLACQYLQNPLAGQDKDFHLEWIRRYEVRPQTLNVAILCDPAGNEKKDKNCNTAIAVIGIDRMENKYLLDGACHKMGLDDRWQMIKSLRTKWLRQPGVQVVRIGYEKYGMQTDTEHFEIMMRLENNFFPIEEVNWPREGSGSKDARIRRLIPDHKNWRFFYPYEGEVTKLQQRALDSGRPFLLAKPIKRKDHNGSLYNLVKWFIQNEYMLFPATTLKDFLDAMSRIYDIDLKGPMVYDENELEPEAEGDY